MIVKFSPKMPGCRSSRPKKPAPMVVGLRLIHHHRALFAAVAAEVTLAVAVDVQPAHHHRPSTGFL